VSSADPRQTATATEVYDKGSSAMVTGLCFADDADQFKSRVGVGVDPEACRGGITDHDRGSADWGLVSIGAGTALTATNSVIRGASSVAARRH
jgi:hypothetical protein